MVPLANPDPVLYTMTMKHVLHSLPLVKYQGPIYLIKNLQRLEQALSVLKKETVLGFDTESRPAFRQGERYLPSLLQLAAQKAVYLFPIQNKGFLSKLKPILEAPSILKVGLAIKDDLRHLQELHPFDPKGFLELSLLSRHIHTTYTGLRNLAGIFLGLRISKSAQTSNWAQPILSVPQMIYAATDAWVSRELYYKLKAALAPEKWDRHLQEALLNVIHRPSAKHQKE